MCLINSLTSGKKGHLPYSNNLKGMRSVRNIHRICIQWAELCALGRLTLLVCGVAMLHSKAPITNSPDCYTIELIPQRQKTAIPSPLPSNRFRDTTTIPPQNHHTFASCYILPTSFSMAKRGSSPERSRLPSSACLPIHRKLGRKL